MSAGTGIPSDVIANGLETNARNPSLLGTFGLLSVMVSVVVGVVPYALLLLQETKLKHPRDSKQIAAKTLFNPGTPKGMSDSE
ncbi:MAG: hypothetical protein ACRD2S_10810 [Terriglobales bacterium]